MNSKLSIVRFSEKLPGGMPLLAMFTTMLINTFFPEFLNVGYYTTALFSSKGTETFIGLIIFVSGSQVVANSFFTALLRGGVYMLLRFVTGIGASFVFHALFGLDGFLGISTLAFVICLCALNPGVYMTGMQKLGDDVDRAVFGPLNLWAVPTMPLVVLSISSGASIDPKLIYSILIPFLLGFVLGNLDSDFRKFLSYAPKIVVVFLFATFGANINLFDVFSSGLSGLLLTIIFTVISLILSVATDRLILKGRGYAGAATCAVCGSFVPSAALVAEALPQYAPYVASATAQVSMAYVITVFSSLFIAEIIAKKVGCPALQETSSD